MLHHMGSMVPHVPQSSGPGEEASVLPPGLPAFPFYSFTQTTRVFQSGVKGQAEGKRFTSQTDLCQGSDPALVRKRRHGVVLGSVAPSHALDKAGRLGGIGPRSDRSAGSSDKPHG